MHLVSKSKRELWTNAPVLYVYVDVSLIASLLRAIYECRTTHNHYIYLNSFYLCFGQGCNPASKHFRIQDHFQRTCTIYVYTYHSNQQPSLHEIHRNRLYSRTLGSMVTAFISKSYTYDVQKHCKGARPRLRERKRIVSVYLVVVR